MDREQVRRRLLGQYGPDYVRGLTVAEVSDLLVELEQAAEKGQNLVDALGMEREMRKDAEARAEQAERERDEAVAKRDGLMEQLGRTEYRLGVLKNLQPGEYTQADLDFFADNADEYAVRAFKAEAQVAKVPALVEWVRNVPLTGWAAQQRDDLLAAFEQEQKP